MLPSIRLTRHDKAVLCGVGAAARRGDGSGDQDVTSPARDVDRAVRGRQEIEMSCRIATVPMKRIAQLYVEVKRELWPVNYL